MYRAIMIIVFLSLLCSCKSAVTGQQKTLTQAPDEEIPMPETFLVEPVIPPVAIPESIKEIILAHISEDELKISDYWRIAEDKRYYWEVWHSLFEGAIPTAFNNAIGSGNIQMVQEMLRHYGKFMRAWEMADIAIAKWQNVEMVRLLLDSGFVLDWGGDPRVREHHERFKPYTTLAIFAQKNDDPAVIQLLIDRGAEITDFAVFTAVENEKCENVRVLIKAGGNARARDEWNDKTALFAAAEDGCAKCLALLLDSGAKADIEAVETYMGETPLLAAADTDSAECVELLLNAGANPEAMGKYGDFALRNAVKAGNERSVQLLLNSSAVKTIHMSNPEHQRPFNAVIEAARRGHASILQMLIEKGGDVNMKTGDIRTLFHIDSLYLHIDLSTNGEPFGYETNTMPLGGQTALMLASTPECVEILLRCGADVNAKDNAGRNALVFQCLLSSSSEIISMLIKAGSYLYLDRDGGRSLLRLAAENIATRYSSEADEDIRKKIIALLKAAGCKDDDRDAKAEFSFYTYYAN